MPDVTISTDDLTRIENTLVMVREAIDTENQNPEAQKIMESIVEAEQIIASKLDKQGTETTPNAGGYQAQAPKPMAH